MAEKILRRGVVEIETLRRWGRVPIGTRAQSEIELIAPGATASYWVQYNFRIGDDPRPLRVSCGINMFSRRSSVVRVHRTVRGVSKLFEGNLFEYALMCVVDSLEEMNTPSGYQRFRVLRAEWTDSPSDTGAAVRKRGRAGPGTAP